MIKRSVLCLLITGLTGCGGSSDEVPQVSDIQPGFGNDITESFEADMRFYAPSFISQKGELIIQNLKGNVETRHQVESLNRFSLTLPVDGQYHFKFEPDNSQVSCPREQGCGRSLLNDPNDLNGNNEIDFGEPINAEISYEAIALPVPGLNQLLFSTFSSALVSAKLDSAIWSLTAAPNYHITQSTILNEQKAEYVANALTYADIMQQHTTGQKDTSLFSNAIAEGVSGNSEAISVYKQLANQYLSETLLSEESNTVYRVSSAKVLLEVNELLRLNSSRELHTEIKPYTNELLTEVRNALGVLRLQDEQYSEEIKSKLEEVEDLANSDAQNAFLASLEVIGDVVKHVSPFEGSVAGEYSLPGLNIEYQTENGFRWIITGVRRGFEVDMDITVPQWRISPLLGDKIVGSGKGSVTKPDIALDFVFDQFEIVTEGRFDPNNIEEVVGVSDATGNVKLTQGSSILSGDIEIDYLRKRLSVRTIKAVIPYLSIDGVLTTPNQVTPIRLYANERSPLAMRSDMDLVFGAQLELPLNGGKDLRIQLSGEPDMLSDFTSADVSLILGGHVSEVTVTNLVGNINLIVRGRDGYWVDIKKKKKLYTGGFYFGDKLVGDVRTIRGIPGILFPDGSFESLF
ncbi:hypothetical protein [Pseudoalteromonas luteoviolacea]|uniref:hypothetical protein n=1 Tax=Pseudoalteromonas luteoviolacea TaxID=43657 RepID=UPI001B396930|nr:hypothetical protein [Pseudoalteromonas luteoviolacea]MBQ4836730.1 hypothetical protein [Pseudoalteromonas luteoviolacea]